MGLGDPYHKHPLRMVYPIPKNKNGEVANCFHCELPITGFASSNQGLTFSCYGCTDCDYYIHRWCQNLPIILRHPLHDQHPLTRIEPQSSSNSPNLCNECHNPCLGRFAYHCFTCQFFFHLKCLSSLNHEKHDHPLILAGKRSDQWSCKVCGFRSSGLNFGCRSCNFSIHPGCSFIPVRIKHHHIHELTLRHNFPQECDQVYCDLCEDKDGELNRKLSYYYCKRCDYIAHVHCCITQPRNDSVLYESFTHEHPLTSADSCNQCDYVTKFRGNEYPFLIKHPSHPEHTLVFVDRKRGDAFKCTECQFTMDKKKGVSFTHPLWRYVLEFYCENKLFRCDACGELGKGSRVGYDRWFHPGEFELHLECFALPGKLEHESHPHHPLYLRWLYNISTSRYCSVCTKEMDAQLWFYFCQECDYVAHMNCVAGDLLLALQSSIKNHPNFCAIIEPNKTSFEFHIADSRPREDPQPFSLFIPVLKVPDGDNDGEAKSDLGKEAIDDGLCCPKCNLLISTEARYSTIKNWESSHSKDEAPSASEPLSFLDEKIVDELFCSICNVFIFPPTYSCASCQIFFHKSCAELPMKIIFNETTYVLTAPPFPEGFSNCNLCEDPISSFAYLCSVGGFNFDVQCASRAPLVNQSYHHHDLFFLHIFEDFKCLACKNSIEKSTVVIACDVCQIYLHPECGLLPPVIKHRIHQHPLELATDLAELYDEYVCDVCEKDLNPNLWAYRCVDSCGIKATSHVTCVITSKNKYHFRYEDECQNMTEEQKLTFRKTYAGNRK